MATVYVVREGKVRGEGRYRASGIPAWTGGRWAPTIKDAFRFTSRSMAMRNARKCKGRPVRLVTIPEQLRNARAELAQCLDERAIDCEAEYRRGRADERAAVADSLRLEAGHFDEMSRGPGAVACDYAVTLELARQAKRIERGEHVKGGG